ncbi:MAG TPA: erythronate-4-phosphate dehydrogenase [Rikenellaceae bacterium]|nr:erythronate-4-phosphate dehydrogenase [Rikenellaceae bacterium]
MDSKIKIIADADIPFLRGVIEPFADIVYLKGNEINAFAVSDADALIIRTRTNCNAGLLENSRVKFIASATIGTEHVDKEYCDKNGIYFTAAAGCNAWGVVQYVIAAIFDVCNNLETDPCGKTIGIIGAGNVGERLAQTALCFGMNVLRCDPPVRELLTKDPDFYKTASSAQRGEIGEFYVDRSNLSSSDYITLNDLLEKSDIVSVHTPLNDSTREMVNAEFLSHMRKGAIFINSSRGEVINEKELISYRDNLGAVVTDVWSREPLLNLDLMNISSIATPHIAGYSLEGKANATRIVVNKLGGFYGIDDLAKFSIVLSPVPSYSFIPDGNISGFKNIVNLLENIYSIEVDDRMLRSNPGSFEYLRGNYNYRREFSPELFDIIEHLKFK